MNNIIDKKKIFSPNMCGSPYLLFLIVIYVTFYLAAEALVQKLVIIDSGLAVGGMFLLPFLLLIEDVIAEVYGYKISRFLIWLVLLGLIVFTVVLLIIIHLPSPSSWHLQPDYNQVFDPMLHVVPVSILQLLISQFINIFFMTKLKIFFVGRFFWIRSIFASTFSGIVIATVFFVLAYGASVSLTSMKELLLTDYVLRFGYAVLGGGPAWLLVIYLKKKENIDVYDINTNFNPFKLSLKD